MKMGHIIRVLFLVHVLGPGLPIRSCAQEIEITSGFVSDSVKIGDVTRYFLTARYPQELSVLFPDSSYNFGAFGYDSKRYFQTETMNGESYDSVVYYVDTYSMDTLLRLSLPVYIAHEGDCTSHFSPVDSIRLQRLTMHTPDSVIFGDLPLKEIVSYERVPRTINLPLITTSTLAVVLAGAIAWMFFGDPIRRRLTLRRLLKNHRQFLSRYDESVLRTKENFSVVQIEATLNVWKSYMEKLEEQPYTKYTTRETIRLVKDEHLNQSLKMIDRAIYGSHKVDLKPFQTLKDFANAKYQTKVEEVKHG